MENTSLLQLCHRMRCLVGLPWNPPAKINSRLSDSKTTCFNPTLTPRIWPSTSAFASKQTACSATALPSESPANTARLKQTDGREKYLEFPFASAAHKKVMVDLFLGLEDGLQNHLLPCNLPPDVQYYSNPSGSVQCSFQIRSGLPQSPIDFIWGSWVHYERPNGSSLEVTSLTAYLKASTDAPNFGIDLIRHSPTVLVLILDLFHRIDLPLHPHYLKTFYEDTQLDSHREAFQKLPEAEPYVSPSLYMRTIVSPTAIMVRIDTEGSGGEERLEEIIRTHLDPISKQLLKTWLDHCAFVERDVGEAERAYLKRRDVAMRTKSLDIDLAPSIVEWFGEEQGKRIVDSLRKYFFTD